jgi:hypothetical protein
MASGRRVFPLQSNIFDKVDFIVEGQREENHPLDNDQPNSKNFVLPADISPVTEMLPTASTSCTNNFSRRGSAALITGSQHKQKLLTCMKKKIQQITHQDQRKPLLLHRERREK